MDLIQIKWFWWFYKVRTSGDEHFAKGDSRYYKHDSSNQWHGPGEVIGHEGKQLLIKHGATYIQVHSRRLSHAVSSKQNKFADRANDGNLESPRVITTNNVMFHTDSSGDKQSPVSDDMDMVNDNRDLTSYVIMLSWNLLHKKLMKL